MWNEKKKIEFIYASWTVVVLLPLVLLWHRRNSPRLSEGRYTFVDLFAVNIIIQYGDGNFIKIQEFVFGPWMLQELRLHAISIGVKKTENWSLVFLS